MNTFRTTASVLLENIEGVAVSAMQRQYQLQPFLTERYGSSGWDKSVRDTRYHLSYLAQAAATNQPVLFTNYIEWARIVLEARGMPVSILTTTLECMQHAIQAKIPPAQAGILNEILNQGLSKLAATDLLAASQSFLDPSAKYGELACQYLEMLLKPDRHAAIKLILDAVQNGVEVKDIYLKVFQPVQHEIGRLWQINQISVAQEHYATAVTQQVMSQLYGHIFAMPKKGKTLVAACVGSELHEIGVRMVADLFEIAGWNTYFLGANTPTPDIIKMILDQKADVLAVSVTLIFHLESLEQLVRDVRASEAGKIKILAGGYPFNVAADLWQQLGADGYAADAEQAIQVAELLSA